MSNRHKNGPERKYRPDEIELYARHRNDRARVRPRECIHASLCWVEAGPPAIAANGWCIGCDGVPGGGNPHGGRPRGNYAR